MLKPVEFYNIAKSVQDSWPSAEYVLSNGQNIYLRERVCQLNMEHFLIFMSNIFFYPWVIWESRRHVSIPNTTKSNVSPFLGMKVQYIDVFCYYIIINKYEILASLETWWLIQIHCFLFFLLVCKHIFFCSRALLLQFCGFGDINNLCLSVRLFFCI